MAMFTEFEEQPSVSHFSSLAEIDRSVIEASRREFMEVVKKLEGQEATVGFASPHGYPLFAEELRALAEERRRELEEKRLTAVSQLKLAGERAKMRPQGGNENGKNDSGCEKKEEEGHGSEKGKGTADAVRGKTANAEDAEVDLSFSTISWPLTAGEGGESVRGSELGAGGEGGRQGSVRDSVQSVQSKHSMASLEAMRASFCENLHVYGEEDHDYESSRRHGKEAPNENEKVPNNILENETTKSGAENEPESQIDGLSLLVQEASKLAAESSAEDIDREILWAERAVLNRLRYLEEAAKMKGQG